MTDDQLQRRTTDGRSRASRLWRGLSLAPCLLLLACGAAVQSSPSAPSGAGPTVCDDGVQPDTVRRRVGHAVEMMDAGRVAESIDVLEALRRTAPHSCTVLHELGLAYRLSGRPDQAVLLLEPYEASLPAESVAGLGSAADEAGDPARAEAILQRGLERFPGSGLLHSELATTLAGHGRADEAAEIYVQGMQAEPAWPSNYLQAARLFSESPAGGMTLYWGEVFRLLEPGSERSEALAILMVQTLASSVEVGGGNIVVHLAPGEAVETAGPDGTRTIPFVHAFELQVGSVLAMAVVPGLSLASLHAARATLAEGWQRASGPPSTELFAWLADLASAGHLEAYDYWLYGPAFMDEASSWLSTHEAELDAMAAYVGAHPFLPTAMERPDTPVPAPAAEVPPGSL